MSARQPIGWTRPRDFSRRTFCRRATSRCVSLVALQKMAAHMDAMAMLGRRHYTYRKCNATPGAQNARSILFEFYQSRCSLAGSKLAADDLLVGRLVAFVICLLRCCSIAYSPDVKQLCYGSKWWRYSYQLLHSLIQFFSPQLEAKKEEKEAKKDLPPVKEPDVSTSNKDPSNFSGCVVSWASYHDFSSSTASFLLLCFFHLIFFFHKQWLMYSRHSQELCTMSVYNYMYRVFKFHSGYISFVTKFGISIKVKLTKIFLTIIVNNLQKLNSGDW